ncbi:MAG: 3-oxoacyl-ACP synthase III [Thermoguttaceae bacterium]
MRYTKVFVDTFTATLPEEVVTTVELEERLAPVYERLRLPHGRLELMTGIRERRLWSRGTTITSASVRTVKKLIDITGVETSRIGAFVHASVCRDFLEPATACGVHQQAGLPATCCVYDVSNACLGILTGMIHVANMIELGQIEVGIVVGSESSRSLMESTIDYLNTNTSLDRQSIKKDFASLTIGSGSAAVLLTNERLARRQRRLVGGAVRAKTEFCHLCQSDTDQSGGDTMRPLMQTDSESLLNEGVAAAAETFPNFLIEVGWSASDITKTFCHQVGKAHQQLLFERLGLSSSLNYATLDFLGNTGSVALPTAAALGIESGFATDTDRIALLGIGSGINVVMLGLAPS